MSVPFVKVLFQEHDEHKGQPRAYGLLETLLFAQITKLVTADELLEVFLDRDQAAVGAVLQLPEREHFLVISPSSAV
jgi:hypothetical protein